MAPSAITTTNSITPVKLNQALSGTRKYSNGDYIQIHGNKTPEQLVGDALKKRVDNIDINTCKAGDEDAFFVADLGEVYRQHLRWKLNLPRVKPHYGMSSFDASVTLPDVS